MDTGRLGQGRSRKEALVGDLVVCIDTICLDPDNYSRRFIGLVLDKSITVCKIQVLDTGKTVYWPIEAMFLWKEGNT